MCLTMPFSKPLMDLLVMLCAKYHLNPSSHTLELVTTNRKDTKLKPNALIGTLDAEKIILKPKGEDKNKKTGPQMPEVCQTCWHTVNTTLSCSWWLQYTLSKWHVFFVLPGNCSDGDKLQKDPENYTTGQSSSSPGWTLTSHLWEMWIWHRVYSSVERCPLTGPFGLVLLFKWLCNTGGLRKRH